MAALLRQSTILERGSASRSDVHSSGGFENPETHCTCQISAGYRPAVHFVLRTHLNIRKLRHS